MTLMTTFTQLEQVDDPTFEDLSRILESYAEGGWSVSGRVVTRIIRRMTLSEEEKNKLTSLARIGIRVHKSRCEPEETWQYEQVINALS